MIQKLQPVPTHRMMPMREVVLITSLSKATIYRQVATGQFPAPARIGKGRVAWGSEEVFAWLAHKKSHRLDV